MKICVAQTKPVKGDIPANIANHKKLIALATQHHADVIIFPELSLTGYEPTLANHLACNVNDSRLDDFQIISDHKSICIGVGMPVKNNGGVSIGMIIFQPGRDRQVYFKKYLHPDEDPFFVPGQNLTALSVNGSKISLAICYELSIDEHTENACRHRDGIYIASVAKSVKGIDHALQRLSAIACQYATTVFMSNCTGICDGEICAGKSSVWNSDGSLLHQLGSDHDGMILFDTLTKQILSS